MDQSALSTTHTLESSRSILAVCGAIIDPEASLRKVMETAEAELRQVTFHEQDAQVEIVVDAERITSPQFERTDSPIIWRRGSVSIEVSAARPSPEGAPQSFPSGARQLVDAIGRLLELFSTHSDQVNRSSHAIAPDALLSTILENGPIVGLTWKHKDGWTTEFISNGIRQFGYEPDDFLSGAIQYPDIIHRDDRSQVNAEFTRHLAEGHSQFKQSYRIVTRNGETRWLDSYVSVLPNTDGTSSRCDELIVDVTNTVLATHRAQRYLSEGGMLLVKLDADGTILMVNKQTCSCIGLSENELIGSNWIERFVPAEMSQALRDHLSRIRLENDDRRIIEREGRIRSADGSNRVIKWRETTEQNPDGSFYCLTAFGIEVTEARSLETRAKELESLPTENPSPVLRVDRNGDVVLANEAAQVIIDHLSLHSDRYISRKQRQDWVRMIQIARSAKENLYQEISVGRATFGLNLVPVKAQDYVNIYGVDVTDAKKSHRIIDQIASNLPGTFFLYTQYPDGSYEISNVTGHPEMLWEVSAEQVEAHPAELWLMIEPDDLPSMQESVAKSARALEVWDHVWRVRTKSGQIRFLHGRGYPMLGEGGEISWNTLILDDTEQQLAKQEVKSYVNQLEMVFEGSVELATTMVEMRDPYTAGHAKRVAEIASAIGAELGLNEERTEGLRIAGQLHDIGKIKVPSELLSRPGELLAPEFEIIKFHAEAGYDVLKNVRFPWPVADVAHQHHERIDGSGYPQGLKGDAICLEARIMAVADVVEAMASHRPYRPGLGIDKALEEIERGSAIIYDKNVCDACLRLFREGNYTLPSQ